MSAHGIADTVKQYGAPPLEKTREPNFSKLVVSLINVSYPPGTLRRKYCIDYFAKAASLATTLAGTVIIITLLAKTLFNKPREIGFVVLTLAATFTLFKLGQKIHAHYQAWKEFDLRGRGDDSFILPKASLQRYLAHHISQMFVTTSYVVGALFALYILGSAFDTSNKIATGAFLAFDIFVIMMGIGFTFTVVDCIRNRPPRVVRDVEQGQAAEAPPQKNVSAAGLQIIVTAEPLEINVSSAPPPIPSKMLSSLTAQLETVPPKQ